MDFLGNMVTVRQYVIGMGFSQSMDVNQFHDVGIVETDLPNSRVERPDVFMNTVVSVFESFPRIRNIYGEYAFRGRMRSNIFYQYPVIFFEFAAIGLYNLSFLRNLITPRGLRTYPCLHPTAYQAHF